MEGVSHHILFQPKAGKIDWSHHPGLDISAHCYHYLSWFHRHWKENYSSSNQINRCLLTHTSPRGAFQGYAYEYAAKDYIHKINPESY